METDTEAMSIQLLCDEDELDQYVVVVRTCTCHEVPHGAYSERDDQHLG